MAENRTADGLNVDLKSRMSMNLKHPHTPTGYTCNSRYIADAKSIFRPHVTIRVENKNFPDTVAWREAQIEKLRSEGKSRVLENGLERLKKNDGAYYVFPRSWPASPNMEGMVFDCSEMLDRKKSTAWCSTDFKHPSGLIIHLQHRQYFGEHGEAHDFSSAVRSASEELNEKIAYAQSLMKENPEYSTLPKGPE